MKFKNHFYSLMLLLLVFGLMACGGGGSEAPKTDEQKLVRTWKVSSAKMIAGGTTTDVKAQFANFTITFTASADGKGSTYTVVSGTAPSKPSAGTNGTWTLLNPTTITLDRGSANERTIIFKSTITETKITISWQAPRSEDKTQPTYEIELIPA